MNQDLINAIEQNLIIRIYYTDGYREVEPYTYGIGTSGNDLLRGYQISGASESGKSSGWKLFKINEIDSLQLTSENFSTRSEYRKGDKAMRSIYAELQ